MTAAQEKASEQQQQQQQQQAPREWVPDGRKIYDDILPTLAFKTVKSWADTRVGDNRKTSVYHLAAYIRWRKARGLSTNPRPVGRGVRRLLSLHEKSVQPCSREELAQPLRRHALREEETCHQVQGAGDVPSTR